LAVDVSVLMVVYGRWDLTERCVRSLLGSRGVSVRITLVDNGHPDPAPQWAKGTPGLRYHRSGENLGFAAGMNLAFREARPDGAGLCMVVNNDTVFPPGSLDSITEFMSSRPDAGAAGPPILHAEDPQRVWSAGGFLQPWLMRFDQRRWPTRADLPSQPVEVDMLSGCAMMVRSDILEALGGFREDLFMYYEDADLCRRMSEAGHGVWLVPGEEGVLHHVEASSAAAPWLPQYCSRRNRLIISPAVQTPVQRAFFVLWMWLGTLLKTLASLRPGRVGGIPWLWRAMVHGLAGRGGPPRKTLRRWSGARHLPG